MADINNYLLNDFTSLNSAISSVDELLANEYNTYATHKSQYYRILSVVLTVDLLDWYLTGGGRNMYRYALKTLYAAISEIIGLNVSLAMATRYDLSNNNLSYTNAIRAVTFVISNYVLNTRSVTFSTYYRGNNISGIESIAAGIASFTVDYLFFKKQTLQPSNITA